MTLYWGANCTFFCRARLGKARLGRARLGRARMAEARVGEGDSGRPRAKAGPRETHHGGFNAAVGHSRRGVVVPASPCSMTVPGARVETLLVTPPPLARQLRGARLRSRGGVVSRCSAKLPCNSCLDVCTLVHNALHALRLLLTPPPLRVKEGQRECHIRTCAVRIVSPAPVLPSSIQP